MGSNPTVEVGGDTGVKGMVRAFYDVDVPGHAGMGVDGDASGLIRF